MRNENRDNFFLLFCYLKIYSTITKYFVLHHMRNTTRFIARAYGGGDLYNLLVDIELILCDIHFEFVVGHIVPVYTLI